MGQGNGKKNDSVHTESEPQVEPDSVHTESVHTETEPKAEPDSVHTEAQPTSVHTE